MNTKTFTESKIKPQENKTNTKPTEQDRFVFGKCNASSFQPKNVSTMNACVCVCILFAKLSRLYDTAHSQIWELEVGNMVYAVR